MSSDMLFGLPPIPTNKKRIVFSFGVCDEEFFKCFPSDEFLGARYDRNPAQLLIKWDTLIKHYHCELQIFNPRNQLLVSFPIPKSSTTPYTIVDGMINEWITKEEFVYFQFVFTGDGGEFVKSTLPVRMNLSDANKPNYTKLIKPVEFDRMKELYDRAVTNVNMKFSDVSGWSYDFFSCDGTLLFSLDWVPKDVIRGSDMILTPNEKMVARANINVPFTFVLPIEISDGTNIIKSTATYINKLENATFEIWEDNGDGSFTEVVPVSKSYSGSEISAVLQSAINGYLRVSCKSTRFIPSDDGNLVGSDYSGNLIMSEDWQTAVVGEGQDE